MVAACALPACNCGENNTGGTNNGVNNGSNNGSNNGVELAIDVSPTQLQTTEAGGTAEFTIALNAEPTDPVTVSLASTNEAEGTVSPTSVTLDESNWEGVTVTVTGQDDDVADGDQTYTITTDAGDLDADDVTVTNVDNDMATVNVMPTSVTVSEDGMTAEVTVAIGAMPSGDVTVSVTPADAAQLTVNTDTLTFTEANSTQSFTITAVDDDAVEGNPHNSSVALTIASDDAAYAAIDPTDISVSIIDNEEPSVAVSPVSLTLNEAGTMTSGTFEITLGAAPADDVTIDLSSSDTTEATVSPAQVTLNAGSPTATVTVTAVDDTDLDGAQTITIVTGDTASNDASYNGVAVADVSVTVLDNEQAEIDVTPTSFSLTETGPGQDTFTVSLTAAPAADVVVNLAASSMDVTLSSAALTFTAANWQTGQPVTVTAVDDNEAEGNETVTIDTTVATQDPAYANINPDNVVISVIDNDVASIDVNPQTLTVSETGTTATFSVNIGAAPTADVTIDLASSDTSEATVSPASITFAAGAAPAAQTVTVTGVQDTEDDGTTVISIVTTLNTTAAEFAGTNVPDVTVSVTDDDVAGFTVSPVQHTILEGGSATTAINLNSAPTGTVTIALASNDTSNVTVSPASLTFTAADFSTAKNVTLTAVDDAIDDGPVSVTVVTTATSADTNYNNANVADIIVTATDNDSADFSVTTGNTITTEGGGTVTFTVALTAQPSDVVTLRAFSNDTSEGIVTAPMGGTLTFNSMNWQTGVQVTVTGQNDTLQDGAQPYQILFDPSVSNDAAYAGRSPNAIDLVNQDNEAGFTVRTATGGDLSVSESGTEDSFTVVLNSPPTQNVDVVITGDAEGDGFGMDEYSFSPNGLIFTPTNWSTPQTVTVTGLDDSVLNDDVNWTITVEIGNATVDAQYQNDCNNACGAQTVDGTTLDDDSEGVTVTPTSVTLTEGGSCVSVDVILATPPTGTVSFSVTMPDTDGDTTPDNNEVSLGAAPSTIGPGCGNNCRTTFSLCGTDDAFPQNQQQYTVVISDLVSTVMNDPYNGLPTDDVAVTINDDDTPQVNITYPEGSFQKRIVYEAGNLTTADEFVVAMNTPISSSVVVTITSGDATEGLLSTQNNTPSPQIALAFNPNPNPSLPPNPQSVRIHAVDDGLSDGSVEYQVTFSVTSGDTFYNGQQVTPVNAVTIDDDAAGWTVVSDATQPFQVNESGTSVDYRIYSNTSPTATLTATIDTTDDSEGDEGNFGPLPDTVTYNSGCTAPCARNFEVYGIDDNVVDGPIDFQIAPTSLTGTDPNYVPATTYPTISATNADNDGAGVMYCSDVNCNNQISSFGFREDDVNNTVYVALTSEPSAASGTPTVVLSFASSDTGEFTVDTPITRTFDDGNWDDPQPLSLDGVLDNIQDGPQAVTLLATLGAGTNSTDYTGDPAADLNVNVADIDVKAIIFNNGNAPQPGATIPISENGGTATIQVRLESEPSGMVTIPVYTFDPSVFTVSPSTLTFGPGDWDQNKAVTVTAVDDVVVQQTGFRDATLVFDISLSGDADYQGLGPFQYTIRATDDDAPGVLITQPSNPPYLVVDEDGSTATFQVVLLSAPAPGNVVTIRWGAPSMTQRCVQTYEGGGTSCQRGTITASTTFNNGNWDAPQTVTVTGGNDGGGTALEWFFVQGTVDNTVMNADPAYTPATDIDPVLGVNVDNDIESVVVLGLPYDLDPTMAVVTGERGATGTFYVRLTQLPTSDVTLNFTSSSTAHATVQASTVLNAGNYRALNPIVVTGQNGDNAINPTGFTTYDIDIDATTPMGGDPDYNGESTSINGFNIDNDQCQLVTIPADGANPDLLLHDGERAVPFLVSLAGSAVDQVNVTVTTDDNTVANLLNPNLAFVAGAVPQVVWAQTTAAALGADTVTFTATKTTSDACYTPATSRDVDAEVD